jgi:predicted acyltransferase
MIGDSQDTGREGREGEAPAEPAHDQGSAGYAGVPASPSRGQPPITSSRIVSLDQYRGYTVTGMILVNYLGGFAVVHPVLEHHNTYFSYADTIMPGFHFAVGFALRLVLLKRIAAQGRGSAYLSIVRRGLGLVLLSTVLEFATSRGRFKDWSSLVDTGVWGALAGPLKCEFWETLAIIGVTSIWVLPVIAGSVRLRVAFLLLCTGLHVLLCHLFYFDFMYARHNWLDSIWGAANVKGLDGGPFGFLAWTMPQLVGSFAYDCVVKGQIWSTFFRLLLWSMALMIVGYGLSCLSMVYPRTQPPTTHENDIQVAASPVVPPVESSSHLGNGGPRRLGPPYAEPPFVQPPASEQRQLNYWLMDKRIVTLPFNVFSSGFSLAAYAFFVLLSDLGGWQVGFFRTLGQNALAAYILHELVNNAVHAFAPDNSPLWWVLTTFAIYVGITYMFVRHLEKHGIFIRM